MNNDGIVKLTKITSTDPQDIVIESHGELAILGIRLRVCPQLDSASPMSGIHHEQMPNTVTTVARL